MEFDHIIKLTPKELYEKALEFQQLKDYDNYCMYMTMSANYGYKLAEDYMLNDYDNNGMSQKQNYSNTKPFYEATQQYSHSANCLGYIYQNGKGVTKNYNKAKELYEQAIEKGSIMAINNLGTIYQEGYDTIDYNKAKELLEIAAEKGNSLAIHNLGTIYKLGMGVKQDFNKTKELYELAIEKGNSYAMLELGTMYHYAHGIEQDYNKAKELYEMAIEKNNLSALNNLTVIYKTTTDWHQNRDGVIDYYLKINRQEKLKEIYNCNDYGIQMILDNKKLTKEISTLKKKIDELETHIMASPEGELYFEAKESWDKCTQTN